MASLLISCLGGLKGAADISEDDLISIEELYEYIKDNVKKYSKRVGIEQTPDITPSFDFMDGIAELKISKTPQ